MRAALAGKTKLVLVLLLAACVCGCVSRRDASSGLDQTVQAEQAVSGDPDFDDFEEFEEEKTAEVSDPLQGYNRFMFKVNDKLYVWVVRPVAQGYEFVLPERARVSVKSCFNNLLFPRRFLNSLLQLKFKKSGIELARFGINSTIGLVGLFDPASAWFNLEASDEDFWRYMVLVTAFPLSFPSSVNRLCRT
jgi:phospholipid-binding lipoprotein MlaA